jgi:enoyl-CoA hydratase/carnithine racemase
MIDHVISEVAGGVATVRFDRIEAENALTAAMCDAAADALAFAESSSRVRAVLLAGSAGIFSCGIDRGELGARARATAAGDSAQRFLKTLATVEKPVVAAVDGLAAGIGTTMLMLCDYVVASEWSVFSAPFAGNGLPPDAAASLLAPRLMGYHHAFAMLVMGEQFDAERALRVGLVNRVVDPADVETVAMEAAATIASLPPEAVRLTRRLMRGDQREVTTRIDQEAAAFTDLLRSPAAHDALMAYIDAKG